MTNKETSNRAKHDGLQGQSLVEMALLLPLLLVLVIGTIEFGRLFFTKTVITNAAREAAYYLSTHIDDYNPSTKAAPKTLLAAQNDAKNSGVSDVTISIAPEDCCDVGDSVKVTVSTEVKDLIIISFLSNVFSIKSEKSDFPLSSSVEMMVQK